jgi:hypothetical protein
MRKPRLRFLGRVDGLDVYLVSGEHVRNVLDVDFTAGGNEAIYPAYIPPGEIWLDDALHALDRNATCLHEIVERELMLNDGMDYDHAHDIASAREKIFRKEMAKRRPTKFDARRVSAALAEFQKARKTTSRQLDREVAAVLRRR